MLDLPEHRLLDPKTNPAPSPMTPAWLEADPCPPWCTGDHPADEHPDDRAHISKLLDVPVIQMGARRSDGGEAAEPVEYVVTMRRYAGQTETWVCLGDGTDGAHRLDITVESAHRLITVAARLIESAFA